MRFYSFVFKNVIRRRVRSTLTVIGMAVAVGAVVALVGISSSSGHRFCPFTSIRRWPSSSSSAGPNSD